MSVGRREFNVGMSAMFVGRPRGLRTRSKQRRVAITIDDPHERADLGLPPASRHQGTLRALDRWSLQACLFVCGRRLVTKGGWQLLDSWTEHGHELANHSYSHLNFNSNEVDFPTFEADFRKNHDLLSHRSAFSPRFRFPFLKEGDTADKRDSMRSTLENSGYTNGYVTIDASDWYIDRKMREVAVSHEDPVVPLFKEFYIDHILNRAEYYWDLGRRVYAGEIDHVLVLHDNLTTSWFLEDLFVALTSTGWTLINADEAFAHQIFQASPKVLPAGESLVWSLALQSGEYEVDARVRSGIHPDRARLRYPGEDGAYEEDALRRHFRRSGRRVNEPSE